MDQKQLKEIFKLQEQIECALQKNNFEELDKLSKRLDASVKVLLANKETENSLSRSEISALIKIKQTVNNYEELSQKRFKDYTYGVSRSRKMHEAYKQNR